MALVIETGFGVALADSYVSVEDADAYWARMGGDPAWSTATTQQKEVALRRASEFVDIQFFTARARRVTTQGLMWPGPDDTYMVEPLVQRAVLILAPLALPGPLVTQDAPEPFVTRSTDKVGDLEETREYAEPEAVATVAGKTIDWLTNLLAPVVGATGGLVIGQRVRG
jgi:hypothetical protein